MSAEFARGLDGRLRRQQRERRALPPTHRSDRHSRHAIAHGARAHAVDVARGRAREAMASWIHLVWRAEAGRLPGALGRRAPQRAVRRDRVRYRAAPDPGKNPAQPFQARDGGEHHRKRAGVGRDQRLDGGIGARGAGHARSRRAGRNGATRHYAVAGTGELLPQFERLAQELGLGETVRFLGAVPDAELPALYNAADLYVGASRRVELLAEGFGISLVEASACGLAVVGGRSGGVPDAVREGETGILVDSDDPAAVAAGVNELLANPERRKQLGAAGRKAVETYYNWDRVVSELMERDRRYRSRR